MSMKFSQIKTHWTPGQAMEVIQFLDQIRETLWQSYGEEIVQAYQEESSDPIDSELNDDLIF